MKKIFLLIVFFCTVVQVQAQVITWGVKPGVYTKIEPCWGDMYFAYKGNNIGVINGDGTVIVAPEASRITGFYEGLSLVLKSNGGQEKILGILSTDGSYTKVDGTYFTIPNQEFFSEGRLTVSTQRGQKGYMDGNGRLVKEYDVSYISPYSEGYAVVGEGREYNLVDKRFNDFQIQLPSVSPLWDGANVFNGVAIVWDGNGNLYEFNPKRGTCIPVKDKAVKKVLKDADYNPDWDYLGGIALITNRPQNVMYESPQRSAQSLQVTEQGGKYGYLIDEKIILPFQFEQAESFHGNYAIVKTDGKYALLSLHQSDDAFIANVDSNIKYRKSSGKNLIHKFGITLPNLWKEDNVNIKVKDKNGIPISVSNIGGSYEFKADGGNGTRKYIVDIDGDGLKLWSGEITYNYTIEKEPEIENNSGKVGGGIFRDLSVRLEKGNTQANENNMCSVKAYITNPNPADITTRVIWSGSSLLEGSSTTVTVPANGSKVITIYLKVLKAQSGQSVTVKTNAGGSDTISGLQLIPF